MLVFSINKLLNGKYKVFSVVFISIVFSLLHFVFYHYLALSTHRGILTILTLINLFIFGLVRNITISYFGHLYYAWSIHIGWNLIFLSSFVTEPVSEANKFNMYVGSYLTLLLTILLFSFIMFAIKYKAKKKNA
jgi:hypothetical protein